MGKEYRHLHIISLTVKLLITVFGLLFLLLYFSSSSALASGFGNISLIQTVYHVQIDGTDIGIVKHKSVVQKLIHEKLLAATQQHANEGFTIAEKVTFQKDHIFRPRIHIDQVLDALNQQLTIKERALSFSVGKKRIGYVRNREEVNDILLTFKSQYVPRKLLNQLNRADSDRGIKRKDNKSLLNVSLSGKVVLRPVTVMPDDILTIGEAVAHLSKEKEKVKMYTIQKGDVLSKIANRFDLSIKQLEALNSPLSKDAVLHVGDRLKVRAAVPEVSVIIKKMLTKKEKIPFDTIVKKDDNMYKGESKVIKKGIPGKKRSRYLLTYKDGVFKDKKVDKETVLKKPIDRVVKKGTKVILSHGTGSFVWPTVEGYISSRMGRRWGHFHKGIDIARPSSRDILTVDNGTVTSAGWDSGGYGNRVVINHHNGFQTTYNHMSSILVHVGQTVQKGQQIGVMGQTGDATGIHLHFEMYKDGRLVNPLNYLK